MYSLGNSCLPWEYIYTNEHSSYLRSEQAPVSHGLPMVGCRLTPAGKTFDSANNHIFLFLLFHCKSWTKQPWIFFFSAVLPLCDSRNVRRSYAPTTFPTRQAIVATPRGNPPACPPVMTRRYHLSTRSSGENDNIFIVNNLFS